MKKHITVIILLFSIGVCSQNIRERDISANSNRSDIKPLAHDLGTFDEDTIPKTNSDKIKSRTFQNIEGVDSGHYLISATFASDRNSRRAVKKLRKEGFNSNYIAHPSNGLNYVYLERYETEKEAMSAYGSNLNGSYDKEVWMLHIENSSRETTLGKTVSIDEVTYDMLESSKNNHKKAKRKPNQHKLIQKADDYFRKMWYAEAAELYEEALQNDKNNYSFEIIQKVGDAHYFNTDMEKAQYWYTILYEKYAEDMSADNIFKYAHSLKGTSKYARAKRLMRLYHKKLEKKTITAGDRTMTTNEIALDNILNDKERFEIKNLDINTKDSDFSPMFYNEDELVYASSKDSSFFNTRRYKWNDQPYLDLYVAKINEASQDIKNAIKFSKKINTKYHEAAVTFSPDNTTMYFTRNNYGKKLKRDKNGINHLKIYMSNKVDGQWLEAWEVSFNSDTYSTGHPALSADGKQLYFVSDMPGSIGATDIFVVDVLKDGSFSEPRNLGPEINTEQKEMFPFINDKKLYFSSNGHVGLGGLDVYEVALDENGFGKVKNVGKPINSNKDDFSYIVDEETQKGYFASNRKGGKGDDDIYSFKRLIVEEAGENLNAIAGVVTELVTGNVMPEALVLLLDENNIKLKEIVTGEDGSFVFEDLEGTSKYTIRTLKGEFFDDAQTVVTKNNETVTVDVSMKKLKELIVIEDSIKKLKTDMIFFDFDRFHIRNDAAEELDKLVAVMNEYSEMVIKIASHTDSRGSTIYNKYLSDKRAKSSRDYLISKGIAADRIESAIGYGEEKLLNECNGSIKCSTEKHRLNRRSEFIIVSM
ncbi:MAG: OmpA family protein [Saonia sp.]